MCVDIGLSAEDINAVMCAAVEVKNVEVHFNVAGQTAINADGQSSSGDMKTQITETIQNLEKVIGEAGYESKNIVRLNIYTTSTAELFG